MVGEGEKEEESKRIGGLQFRRRGRQINKYIVEEKADKAGERPC